MVALWDADPAYCFSDNDMLIQCGIGDRIRKWKDTDGVHTLTQGWSVGGVFLAFVDGKYVARWDGGDAYFSCSTVNAAVPDAATVACRYDLDPLGVHARPNRWKIINTRNDQEGWDSFVNDFAYPSTFRNPRIEELAPVPDVGRHTLMYRSSATVWNRRLDGVQVNSTAAYSAGDAFYLGIYYATGDYPAFVLYDNAISDEDAEDLETWLEERLPARVLPFSLTWNDAATYPAVKIPVGANTARVQLWGGGGGGGGAQVGVDSGGGGGGGGAYSEKTIEVVPGESISVIVGAGGAGGAGIGDGTAGGYSSITADAVLASGGGEGGSGDNSGSGGTGGGSGGGIGDIKYSGGDGAEAADTENAAGGGSSAGPAADGVAASSSTGATAPTGGGNGGNGAATPTAGQAPGGGGGGAQFDGAGTGAAGAPGKAIITYSQ